MFIFWTTFSQLVFSVLEDFLAMERKDEEASQGGTHMTDHMESMFKSIDVGGDGMVDLEDLIFILFKKKNKSEHFDVHTCASMLR